MLYMNNSNISRDKSRNYRHKSDNCNTKSSCRKKVSGNLLQSVSELVTACRQFRVISVIKCSTDSLFSVVGFGSRDLNRITLTHLLSDLTQNSTLVRG